MVTGSQPISAQEYSVGLHLEGDFPGGVADLRYRFTLRDGFIEDLTIAG